MRSFTVWAFCRGPTPPQDFKCVQAQENNSYLALDLLCVEIGRFMTLMLL